MRNALNTAKLQLALLELELRGAVVTDDARRAVAGIKAQMDAIAALIPDATGLRSDARQSTKEGA
jgi:hypothetical protein